MRQIVTVLQQEMFKCFDKILNPSATSFDPIYVKVTLLDPRFRVILTPEQFEAAKLQLLRDVSFKFLVLI